jgi:hypothetical protein
MLSNLLLPVDVGRVLQIPINHQAFDDFLAWNFTKYGRYTVRYGYHVQWKHQFGASAGKLALPRGSATNPVWKTLWQLKIPSKVKIFILRALHGIPPLKCIPANRHIGTSGGCPICNQGPEDIRHLLFQCQPTTELLSSLGLQTVVHEASIVDMAGSGMLEHILHWQDNTLPRFANIGLKETISVACWYIWWLRRRKTNNEQIPPIYKCKFSILSITFNVARATRPLLAVKGIHSVAIAISDM